MTEGMKGGQFALVPFFNSNTKKFHSTNTREKARFDLNDPNRHE